MKHLWEINHPYYSSDSNYFKQGVGQHYPSWREFATEWEDNDLDLNLLFRWDWQAADEDEDEQLKLFYILQRKGLYMPITVSVTAADEDAVRAYLAPRWERMKLLWEGIA